MAITQTEFIRLSAGRTKEREGIGRRSEKKEWEEETRSKKELEEEETEVRRKETGRIEEKSY